MMDTVTNVLASRYASRAIVDIWSTHGRVIMERELWIAVMRAQKEAGLDIPDEALEAYEAVKRQVDLQSIRSREAAVRHDVKARIDEFCALAGHEHIHKGMTSRDLTESVEQMQIFRSLQYIRLKALACLNLFSRRAQEWHGVVITARTHNVAAQFTTMGKRMAMFGEEMLRAVNRLYHLITRYPARGIKGAVGTQLDILNLFDGEESKLHTLEESITGHLGIAATMDAVGQVYPRSLDFEIASAMYQLGAGPSSFAKTLRLMAGHELASEGFVPGQVGSSAMPHKMNSRFCERLNGLHVVIRGYLTMLEGIAGDQWNEGDVSCSVVRRVALPDIFFAVDGLLETLMIILRQMEINPAVIDRENRYYRPFLLTTTVLMAAVRKGTGRETAHTAIKQHSLETLRALQSGRTAVNNLFERLASDPRIGLSPEELNEILESADETGMADHQIAAFCREVESWLNRYPSARDIIPGDVL